jgi:predicted dehydrogenase
MLFPEKTMSQHDKTRQLGIALLGLGEYAGEELAPALKATNHCKLAAIISDEPKKMEEWRKNYGLNEKCCYTYEQFDEIKNNPEIDIVYVVLPNTLHEEYVLRSAKAGKHVICEKPLATTVEACQRMIDACREAGVKLSMGYRLHFDPYNQEMMRLGQEKVYGQVKKVIARNSMEVGESNQWRLDYERAGGGPLMNNGVYCVQAAQYILGELPVAVKAGFLPKTDPKKFAEVEEGIRWTMDFPSGAIAECETSYSKNDNLLRAEAENGWFELNPAYEYEDLEGRTIEGPMKFAAINQQAAQMDDFALCIRENRESRVPGEMGLRDLEIMIAIYESAKTNKRIELHLEEFESLPEK